MKCPAEGAFKKLKPEPNSGLSSLSGGVSSPGSGISSLPQHAGHTPTTASCPTPARRRHRTTFTQVHDTIHFIEFPPIQPVCARSHVKLLVLRHGQLRNCLFILKLESIHTNSLLVIYGICDSNINEAIVIFHSLNYQCVVWITNLCLIGLLDKSLDHFVRVFFSAKLCFRSTFTRTILWFFVVVFSSWMN